MKRESKVRIDYRYHKEEAQRIIGTHEISYYLLLKPLFVGYCATRTIELKAVHLFLIFF